MATPRQLQNPPIKEALVDIRIGGSQPDASRLKPLRNQLLERYPNVQEKRGVEATLELEQGGSLKAATKDIGFHGLFFKSSDEKSLAQFRPNGFTYNQLGSYTNAENLFDEALELWARYVELIEPDAVIRLAVRYINRLELPLLDGDDLERFLLVPPRLPKGLPGGVTDFVTRLACNDDESGITTIISQKLGLPQDDGVVTLLLDLDVFKTKTLETGTEPLKGHLEALRVEKNRAFFGSLTEEAVRLYE